MKKLIFIFLLVSNLILSQTAILDTNSILIGEQVKFKITNELNNTEKWPIYNDTIVNGIEIINKGDIDTINEIIIQSFIITSWDSGSYYIPSIQFSKHNKTVALLLNVNNVTLEKGAKLKDIKEPMNAPISWIDIWPFIIGILILTLIILLVKYIISKKQNKIRIAPKIIIPADIIALKELDELEEKKIWQAGDIKKYQTKISEIIRRYIETRFKFIALELTTDEIVKNLEDKISIEQIKAVTLVLERADLAKFAKSKPIDIENTESMKLAKDFVFSTKEIKNNE
tara:strand:+ start:454 stop:1308 length:855 start_codon:yes stop_codon:yes gene_type:complete